MDTQTHQYKLLLEKLISGNITSEERRILSETKLVENQLKSQWDNFAGLKPKQETRKDKIWSKISHQTWKRQTHLEKHWLKYSAAAVITLLLASTTTLSYLLSTNPKAQTWYVMNSGRQSMDSVRLSDGTMAILNAGSRITYPETFTGKERRVKLLGQAFFKVSHDKKHPFIVETNNMDITALGTAFEVFTTYNGTTEAILLNGKIKVDAKAENKHYILYPNQKITLNNGKINLESVDADKYSEWRTEGKPSFSHERLSMIIPRLEKWYGTKIECPQEIADYYKFTFTIHDESLDVIMNLISQNTILNHKRNGNGYTIYKVK